jgi:hypothetical protein
MSSGLAGVVSGDTEGETVGWTLTGQCTELANTQRTSAVGCEDIVLNRKYVLWRVRPGLLATIRMLMGPDDHPRYECLSSEAVDVQNPRAILLQRLYGRDGTPEVWMQKGKQ